MSVIQTTLETMKGVRLEIPAAPSTLRLELTVILALIDSLVADRMPVDGDGLSDLTANLLSARMHVVRAEKEAQRELR